MRQIKGETTIEVFYILFMVLIFGLIIGSCVAAPSFLKDDAQRAVENAGNTDVKMGSRAWFGCSDSDAAGFHFTAKNSQGKDVSGISCCGWWKGCTVRY